MSRNNTVFSTIISGLGFLLLPALVVNAMVNVSAYGSSGVRITLVAAAILLVPGYCYPLLASIRRRLANRTVIAAVNLVGLVAGTLAVSGCLPGSLSAAGIWSALLCWAGALWMTARGTGRSPT